MTSRSTADLLATIADDVSEMASVAHALDALTSELDLSAADQGRIRDLQKVDALFQHLDDVAALLRAMSAKIVSGPQLDTRDLSSAIRLDYLKSRVTHTTNASNVPKARSGDVNLF